VKDFYARCCTNLTTTPRIKRRKTAAASTMCVNGFPQDFCVLDQWLFLDDIKPQATNNISEEKLPALLAAHCINARGAIAHGKKTEIFYLTDNLYDEEDEESNGITDIFKQKGGGAKVLDMDMVEDIKEELTKRGPVVLT